MMTRLIVIILTITMLLSCATSKRIRKQNRAGKKIERIKADFPQLFRADTSFVVRKDTIVYIKEAVRFDTVLAASDTLTIVTDKVVTRIEVVRDTLTNMITNYKVRTIVLADTAYIERTDTVFTINREVLTKTEYTNRIPWWIWLIFSALGFWIGRGVLVELYFKYLK